VNRNVALPVEGEVEPILEYAAPSAPETAVIPDMPLPVGDDFEPVLGQAEPPAPKAAVISDVPLPVCSHVQPVLGLTEPPPPKVSVSPDMALPVSVAIVESALDHAEPPAPKAAANPDMPPQANATVEPILERAEPPRAAANSHSAQNDCDDAAAKPSESVQPDPNFPIGYENRSLTKSKAAGGSIGVTIRRVTDGVANALNVKAAYGAFVVDIDENGSAKAAGIEPRDVIIQVDGRDVKEWRDLPRIVADTPIGKEIAVTIVRNSKALTKTVKIGRVEFADEQGDAPQAKSVKADARSETPVKHLAPALPFPADLQDCLSNASNRAVSMPIARRSRQSTLAKRSTSSRSIADSAS
jgi:hypothetical protein